MWNGYIGESAMFVRTKRVQQNGKTYEYLLIVETVRRGKAVRQRVVANLGRKDKVDPKTIDALVKGLAPLTEDVLVLDPHREDEGYQGGRLLGALPVLHRLWEDLGIGPYLRRVNQSAMPVEIAAFAMVAARLMQPSSELGTYRHWFPTVYWPAFEKLSLHHLYRALDLLVTVKDGLEAELWERRRRLFSSDVDLVLVDTTNTYVEGATKGRLAQFGKGKDKRYDKRLITLGVMVTKEGVPIGHEVFPGNTADSRAFTVLLRRLKARFHLSHVILCADTGMVSETILQALAQDGIPYIVGSR